MAAALELSRTREFQRQFDQKSIERSDQAFRNQKREISERQVSNSLVNKQKAAEDSVLRTAEIKRSRTLEVNRVEEPKKSAEVNFQKINNFKNVSARAQSLSLIEKPNQEARAPDIEIQTSPPSESGSSAFQLSTDSINRKRDNIQAIQSKSLSKADTIKNFSQKLVLDTRDETKRDLQKNPERLNRI
jgi:hypothetical protein